VSAPQRTSATRRTAGLDVETGDHLATPSPHNGQVPVEMSRERFEELVGEALDEVPADLLSHLDNVVVLVEDEPPADDPHLLGLYEGIDLTRRGWDYGGALPDRIFIYRNPILAMCDDEDDVVDEVAVTVVHEIAHHFGIDDDRLHELGWG
jgi:predicted Zn-dependent protease with MMP-like domain